MADVATAVAGTLVDMFGVPADAQPEAVVDSTEAGAPAVEAPEPQIEDDDEPAELPEDIRELLDEPDDEDDLEFNAEEYQDAEEIARENARLKKRLKYVEEQNLIKGRKEWKREAKRYFDFPGADFNDITATSRKGFLREAEDRFNKVKVIVKATQEAERKKLTVTQTVEQAAKREADAAAWGKPVTGGAPSTVPATTTADERLQDARKRNNLTGAVRALIERGDI